IRPVCSTPFGISDFGTYMVRLVVPGNVVCSTPFGISDFGTGTQGANEPAQRRCSTPFGISDFGTALVVKGCAIRTSITSFQEHLQRTSPSPDRCSRAIPLESATPRVLPASTALKDLPNCQRALTLQPARGCSSFTVSPGEQAPMLESSVPAYTI